MIHMSYVRDACVSNEMLINDAKCQGYTFYYFWVIKGKPKGVKT